PVPIVADEYRAELAVSSGWTGIVEITLASEVLDQLYQNERVDSEDIAKLPVHTGVVIHSNKGSALARVTQDRKLKLVRGDRDAFGLHGRSAEQRIALDLLLDNEIGIISLGGRAGTGKSALAICAGLEAVME
ncbi:MAG: PhoH family protein, partial [bacterium]